MDQILQGALYGGITVYLVQWIFNKYTKKADTSEIKIVSIEGAVANVSDKAFMAINTVDVKIDNVKNLLLTQEKRLDRMEDKLDVLNKVRV